MSTTRFRHPAGQPAGRPANRLLAAALTAGLLAIPVASRADNRFDLSTRAYDTRGPQTVCLDVFCNRTITVPPQQVVDARQGALAGIGVPAATVWEEVVDARASLAGAEATARAKLGMQDDSIEAGVAATAGMASVFHSEASARLQLAYEVTVRIAPPPGWTGGLFLPACGLQCNLAIDFLHQTRGRFSHSGDAVPGAQASFSETLRIGGQTHIAGLATIAPDAADSSRMAVTPGGDWHAGDLLPRQSVGHTTTLGFHHLQLLPGLITTFQIDLSQLTPAWIGSFQLVLDQAATAGFTDPAAYRVGPGTAVTADFAHTSSFGFRRAVDPSGVMDLSQASVSLQFVAIPAVPEPGSALLLAVGLAAGLAMASLRRGRA